MGILFENLAKYWDLALVGGIMFIWGIVCNVYLTRYYLKKGIIPPYLKRAGLVFDKGREPAPDVKEGSEFLRRLKGLKGKYEDKPLTDGRDLNSKENKLLNRGICPICQSHEFVSGPQGGNARNIACSRGHRFWFAPPFTAEYHGVINVTRDAAGTLRGEW